MLCKYKFIQITNLIGDQTASLSSTSSQVKESLIAMKQDQSTIGATVQGAIQAGSKKHSQAAESAFSSTSEQCSSLLKETEERSSKTTSATISMKTSSTEFLAEENKALSQVQASATALHDVVDEHNLTIYEETGETPSKRERLDTSVILQVETDSELRARYVPTPDISLEESNQVIIRVRRLFTPDLE